MRVMTEEVARALILSGAVTYVLDDPVTFKSGIKSPVYIDNRRLPFSPRCWRTVIVAFQQAIEAQDLDFEIIAGVETAGIPHSAALAYSMRRPSVFIRKAPKDHGLQKRVEGGDVTGRRVVLIEDIISTGGSSLSSVQALRDEGAVVEDCLAIISYGFKQATEAFTEAGVRLHTLTSFAVLTDEATKGDILRQDQLAKIYEWLYDPYNWKRE